MDTIVSKRCVRCNVEKPLTDFYIRSGYKFPDNPPTLPGHYNSECKACLLDRSKKVGRLDPYEPRAKTEALAIEYLKRNGIHAIPGKAISAADVDVVAFGCVWIECKYSRLKRNHGGEDFVFNATPAQIRRGYLAHIILLMCDYEHEVTYHLFDKGDPVFYIDGRVKNGLTYRPGRKVAQKHGNNRVVMVQSMMDSAQDNVALVWQHLRQISEDLRQGK